jgi:hypothetical protein
MATWSRISWHYILEPFAMGRICISKETVWSWMLHSLLFLTEHYGLFSVLHQVENIIMKTSSTITAIIMVIITTLTRVKSNQKLIWVCWTLLVPLFGYIGFLEFHFENYMWKENSVLLFLSHVVSNQVSLIYGSSSLDISWWLRHRNFTSTKPHMSPTKQIPQRHVLWKNLLVTCCNHTKYLHHKTFWEWSKTALRAVLWVFKEPPVLVL